MRARFHEYSVQELSAAALISLREMGREPDASQDITLTACGDRPTDAVSFRCEYTDRFGRYGCYYFSVRQLAAEGLLDPFATA